MKLGRRGEWANAIKRAMATIAILSQLLLVFAPLVELHDGGIASPTISSRTATAGVAVSAGQRSQAPQHNAATCPACIAQSLHAVLQSVVRLPTVAVGEADELSAAPQHSYRTHQTSALHSRAPPALA